MDKYLKLMKSFFLFLVKTAYIGFFFIFCILLLKILYFPDMVIFPERGPEKRAAAAVSTIEKIESNEDQIFRDHFHVTDEYIPRLGPDPDLCIKCHGVYPHIKEEKTLAFLNLHSGFMACEVCHNRKDPEDGNYYLTWVDLETGKTSRRVKGGYGKYPAMIVPVRIVAGRHERLDKLVSAKFSKEYEKIKDRIYIFKRQEEAGLMKIHEINLSKKAVACIECHDRNGYMDFAKLGFPQYRINQLASSEVARMVEHYKTFYIPRMLRPW